MSLINTKCLTCGYIDEVFRAASDWPKTPICEKCQQATEQIHLPKGIEFSAPAVVVYKAPDGSFRFPGTTDPQSRTAKQYAKLGYERQEFKGFAEVRRLESQVGKREASAIRKRVEQQCQFREESLSYRRGEIRQGMAQGFRIPEHDEKGRPTGRMKTVRLGEEARDLMRAAQERNYGKPGPRAVDPGFHLDVYANNRSNRDDSRRPDGTRYRD